MSEQKTMVENPPDFEVPDDMTAMGEPIQDPTAFDEEYSKNFIDIGDKKFNIAEEGEVAEEWEVAEEGEIKTQQNVVVSSDEDYSDSDDEEDMVKLDEYVKCMDWGDKVFVRVNETKLNNLYRDHKEFQKECRDYFGNKQVIFISNNASSKIDPEFPDAGKQKVLSASGGTIISIQKVIPAKCQIQVVTQGVIKPIISLK